MIVVMCFTFDSFWQFLPTACVSVSDLVSGTAQAKATAEFIGLKWVKLKRDGTPRQKPSPPSKEIPGYVCKWTSVIDVGCRTFRWSSLTVRYCGIMSLVYLVAAKSDDTCGQLNVATTEGISFSSRTTKLTESKRKNGLRISRRDKDKRKKKKETEGAGTSSSMSAQVYPVETQMIVFQCDVYYITVTISHYTSSLVH